MSGFHRQELSIITGRLAEAPKSLIVVSGPRQTGKTTLVRQALDQVDMESRYLPVDEPESPAPSLFYNERENVVAVAEARDTQWLIREWQKARRDAERSERGFVLVLDEVQKIPQWSESVKGLWDADRAASHPLHAIVLGSAPLLMQQGLTESLAGRFELIRVSHWTYPEMHEAFGLDLPSYIYFGGYPGAAHLIHDQSRWRDYVRFSLIEPNIERDILAMTRVNKPALLKRAFELGCSYSGEILSYTKMQGQLQDAGNTTTLAHYVDLLSQAGLLAGLSKYSGRQHLRRSSSPKFNVLNTALMTANSGYSFDEAQADRTFWGRLVESAVGAHLFNTGMPDTRLHYWRESPHEVDFVLERARRLISIEVKSGVRHSTAGGQSAFEKRFTPEQSLLVGEKGIPLDEFLSQPARYWFGPP